SHFSVLTGTEVTIEANPEDLDPNRLRGYRTAGVNRLSLGVQSFAARDLTFLGRRHSGETASRAVEWALDAGIDNLSLDFIIGLPGQNRASLRRNFAHARQLGARHLSVYLLEEVAQARGDAWDERAARLYRAAQELLANAGYPQYEVSNFAAKGDRSRHNLKYWQDVPYLGLGPGASSYDGRVDRRNVRSLAAYHRRLAHGELPVAETQAYPSARRRIATGLRTVEGVNEAVFADYRPEVEMLVREGMLERKNGRLSVPVEHFLLLNEILGYFF
ncbi:MAG TPA: coproporphyrinogen-III oxidase family protein, partial [Candidatus Aminicenantes bacterium]|nr:coproporphyrinogen-III oxidase family protein [Candidatus Aminicenantes bacterium]